MEDISPLETLEGVKALLTQLPNVSNGSYAIQYLKIANYGNGKDGFNKLRSEFDKLDLTEAIEFTDLDKKIKNQKKEIKSLEKTHTNLTSILGEKIDGKEGTVAYEIVLSLKEEIKQLSEKKNKLFEEVTAKEVEVEKQIASLKAKEASEITKNKATEISIAGDFKKRVAELEKDYIKKDEEFKKKTADLEAVYVKKSEALNTKFEDDKIKIVGTIDISKRKAEDSILDAEKNASRKVKLINQFTDFLQETNRNMALYFWVIIGVLGAAILAIYFSIPDLLECFKSYDTLIKGYGADVTNWHFINLALGILIVKLPWAFCLSAVLTGMYSLLKGLLTTYEKINQDKRNMSAIYAISGNVAQALNEYGVSISGEDMDEENGETFTSIRVTKKDLEQKKENIRWNQIMKYFEGMQQQKIEPTQTEDPSKLKLVTDILYKTIEKLPKT